MGDVWVPDRAGSLEQVLGCLEIVEEEFSVLGYGQQRLEVCLTAAILVVGYTVALQGEEIPQVDIGMMQNYWSEGRDYAQRPHVPLTLVGCFKQTNGLTKTYVQPLAPITSSGIQVQRWLGRTIDKYNKMQVKKDPMFQAVQGRD
ncbi:hypothetical protein ACA910_013864 [Epithemia clementina (nom. ined.)]